MSVFLISLRDRLWGWFRQRAEGPHALSWLAVFAFLDPIFFPIAPEVFLGALVLAKKEQWRRYIAVTAVFSVLGAVAGYFIAHFLFFEVGEPLLRFYGLEHTFERVQVMLHRHGFLALLLAPFTPIPDKVFVLASGFLQAPFVPFILGFFAGRILRFSLVTYIAYRFGERVLAMLDRYFIPFAILVLLLLIYILLRAY